MHRLIRQEIQKPSGDHPQLARKDASAHKGAAQGYPPSYDLAELEAQGLVVPDFDGKEGQG